MIFKRSFNPLDLNEDLFRTNNNDEFCIDFRLSNGSRLVNRNILLFFSSSLRTPIQDLPCCMSSPTILIPDVTIESFDLFMNVLECGLRNRNVQRVDCDKLQELCEVALNLGVDVSSLLTVSKLDSSSGIHLEPSLSNEYYENETIRNVQEESLLNTTTTTTIEEANLPKPEEESKGIHLGKFENLKKIENRLSTHNTRLLRRMNSVRKGAMYVANDVVRQGFDYLQKI